MPISEIQDVIEIWQMIVDCWQTQADSISDDDEDIRRSLRIRLLDRIDIVSNILRELRIIQKSHKPVKAKQKKSVKGLVNSSRKD